MSVADADTIADMAVVTEANETLYALTVADYMRMFEHGILTGHYDVELLDGALFGVSPESEPHQHAMAILNRILVRGLPDDLLVRINGPIQIRPASMPQPDLAIVPHPGGPLPEAPRTALWAAEVSYTSLTKDLHRKARIYAAAGILEYWVVDLTRNVVHVHLEPRAGRYKLVRQVEPPASLQPTHVELPPIPLADLFG